MGDDVELMQWLVYMKICESILHNVIYLQKTNLLRLLFGCTDIGWSSLNVLKCISDCRLSPFCFRIGFLFHQKIARKT